MSGNARNTVLQEIKAQIVTIDGFVAERVHIGPVLPSQLTDKPQVMILADREPAERLDGTLTRRNLHFEVAVLMKIDTVAATVPGGGNESDIQLNNSYDPIHAKLESLRDGEEKFLVLKEDESGPDFHTVLGQIPFRYVTCGWTVQYERPMGATG